MSSKTFKLILIAIFSFVFIHAVSACIHVPKVESRISDNCSSQLSFLASESMLSGKEVWSNEQLIKSIKLECNISDEDIVIIANLSGMGIDVAEQTEEEYFKFLHKARWQKLNIFKKEKITLISREGKWTGYLIRQKYRFGVMKRTTNC